MINTRKLRAAMLIAKISTDQLAEAEGWSTSTAYRKINGAVAFTVQEMRVCIDLLNLDFSEAEDIFFASDLS